MVKKRRKGKTPVQGRFHLSKKPRARQAANDLEPSRERVGRGFGKKKHTRAKKKGTVETGKTGKKAVFFADGRTRENVPRTVVFSHRVV